MNNNTNRFHDKIINDVDSNNSTRLKSDHRAGRPVLPSTCDDEAGEILNLKPSNTVHLIDASAKSNPDTPPTPSMCDDAAGEVVNPKPSNTVDLIDTSADSNPDTPPAPSACAVPSM